jgi:hypothetical protein
MQTVQHSQLESVVFYGPILAAIVLGLLVGSAIVLGCWLIANAIRDRAR